MNSSLAALSGQANGHARHQGVEHLELLALAHAVGDPQSEHTRSMTTGMLTGDARRTCLSIALAWGKESAEPIGSAVLTARLVDRGMSPGDAKWLTTEIETASVGLIGQDVTQLVEELQRHEAERHRRELMAQGAMAAVRDDAAGALALLSEAETARGGSKRRARIELIGTAQIFGELPPLKWLSDALMLGPGRPTMVVAKGGTGKTMILQSLALSATMNTSIWKKFPTSEQMRVVHLDYEQGKYATQLRYQRLLLGMSRRPEDVGERLGLACLPRLRLTDNDAEDELSRLCEGRHLLIIDSLRACAGGDENDSRMREHVDTLTRVSEATGVAVVFVHHAGKGNPDDPRDLGRGSSALFDACGAVYAVRRSKAANSIEVEMTKIPASAEGQKIEDFGLKFVDMSPSDGMRPISIEFETLDPKRNDTSGSDPDAEFTQTRAAVLALLSREPGLGINNLAPRVGKQKALVQRVLEGLLESGVLDAKDGPRGAKLYFLTSAGGTNARG